MQKSLFRVISIVLFCSLILGGLSVVASARPLGATSPNLGAAESFSILAGSEITNIPDSSISGDVGLSPAAGSNIAGLTALEVGGTIYVVDATGPADSVENPGLLTDAKSGLTTAFDNLDQDCTTTYAGVQDLVGLSLEPGVYCADAFELSGTLTLSGSGVWIFNSASTLITSGAANVVGDNPCDVWWRVESSATLGTNTSLIGNILAYNSIAIQTGASLNGRALAEIGAVTLDQVTIYGPICAIQPVETATATTAPTEEESSPTNTPVVPGLPESGGAPIQPDEFPLGLAIVGVFSVVALAFGLRAYRGTSRLKQ